MKLIDIVGMKEPVYFIVYKISDKREKLYHSKNILTRPRKISDGIVLCSKIIQQDYFDFYGLHGKVYLEEDSNIELVDFGFWLKSDIIKVVYTKDNKKILWEDGEWLI